MMPPVLFVTVLSYTSACFVFSISIAATFFSARLRRMMTCSDWPT
jgi:hypothetical protein